MFEYLKGVLVSIGPVSVVLEVQGVGYLLYVANPYRLSSSLNEEVQLYVHQAVREDAVTLYGFRDSQEKELYLKLISVSGIGPKSGLSILANGDHAGLVRAIESEDISFLTKFPGVGKKTASQIVLDLRGKLGDLTPEEIGPVTTIQQLETGSHLEVHIAEAREALIGLGYSAREVDKLIPLLEEETFSSTEEVLRKAFKLLLKA